MYYIYLLKSEVDGTTYTGYTNNLQKRIREHNAGKTKSIKHKLPLVLIHYEEYLDKKSARKREIELKTNSFRKKELLDSIAMASSSNG